MIDMVRLFQQFIRAGKNRIGSYFVLPKAYGQHGGKQALHSTRERARAFAAAIFFRGRRDELTLDRGDPMD